MLQEQVFIDSLLTDNVQDFLKMRDRLIEEGDFDDPVFGLAKQFSVKSTSILIGAFYAVFSSELATVE